MTTNLRRHFKISGNVCRGGHFEKDAINGVLFSHGIWITGSISKPAFVGEIALVDSNFFCGYCTDTYSESILGHHDPNCYIAGVMLHDVFGDGQPGLAFYKLSNDPDRVPLMYVITNQSNPPVGYWASYSDVCAGGWGRTQKMFLHQGIATASVEELTPSDLDCKLVEQIFDQCNPHMGDNGKLLDRMEDCWDSLIEAYA